jgi:hypothetical protein
MAMSYLHKKHAGGTPWQRAEPLREDPSEFLSPVRAADRAIDAALRSVPLPEGLLSRLRRLAYTFPDSAADRFDYFGC